MHEVLLKLLKLGLTAALGSCYGEDGLGALETCKDGPRVDETKDLIPASAEPQLLTSYRWKDRRLKEL